jgi:hypothetical protein
MAMTDKRPIFIVSSPRSGSTLLRLILDAHPRLAVPPPAWLFHYIYPYLYSYGDLGVEANLRAMVEDTLETPTIKEWPFQAGVDEVIAEMKEPTYTELFSALHRLYARPRGKERWGEKSPRDAFYMAEIKSAYPDAQFIHILRDGRDVAIDLSDSILWPNTLYASALMWKDFVQAIEDSAKELDSDSYHVVRYAELCAQPQTVLRRICEFLGEEFRDEIIAHHETESTKEWAGAPVHANTARPINTDFVDMYKTRIGENDRRVLEGIIGETLRELGFPVEGSPAYLPARQARQLLENDTISNTKAIQYKKWHESQRKERYRNGVWKDSDRESKLLGFF